MTQPHVTAVRHQAAWNEWLARCSCGWTGSYLPSFALAVADAAAHEESPDAE